MNNRVCKQSLEAYTNLENIDSYFNYFDKTWIGPLVSGGGSRGTPIYPHFTRNCFEITLADILHCNNFLEG